MVVLVCTPQQGWEGVEAALRQAEPGTCVQLRSGRYDGATTLVLPAGVELRGEEGVVLTCSSDAGPVLQVGGADCRLTGLKFLGTVSEQILIHALEADGLVVEGCALDGLGLAAAGLLVNHCQRVRVLECQAQRFVQKADGSSQGAIEFSASTGEIKNCECLDSEWGIRVGSEPGGSVSDVTAVGNRCHANRISGIVFLSSEGKIAENQCMNNRSAGIVVRRVAEGSHPSMTVIEGNCCSQNFGHGIYLLSSHGEVRSNESWGSEKGSGIAIAHDDFADTLFFNVLVEGNRSHGNNEAGILFSGAQGSARDNECWGSIEKYGICVQVNAAELPSDVLVEGNRCYANAQSGISFLSSRGVARNNDCWGSLTSAGIAVVRGAKDNSAPSDVLLEDNRCYQNHHAGIAFVHSRGIVRRNECLGAEVGPNIFIQRSEDSSHELVLEDNKTKGVAPLVTLQERYGEWHPLLHWISGHSGRSVEAGLLADFLLSCGCSHCLDQFWTKGQQPKAGEESGVPPAARSGRKTSSGLQQYRVSLGEGGGALIDSEPLADPTARTAVEAMTASLAGLGQRIARRDRRKPPPCWSVALISADASTLTPWLDGTAASEALTRGARRVKQNARPVKAEVVHIEMLGRALQWRLDRVPPQEQGSHATPDRQPGQEKGSKDAGFLEPGLCSPGSFSARWLARLGAEVPWLDFVFSAAVVAALLYLLLEHWGIPVLASLQGDVNAAEVRAALVSGWQTKSWWSLLMEGGGTLAILFSIARWLWNRVLPVSLKMHWGSGPSSLQRLLAHVRFWPHVLQWLGHSGKARHQWLRRRLFPQSWLDRWPWRATHVTVLVLTDLDQPSEADLAELRSIVQLQPSRRPLLIVSQMSGVSMLVNAYLDVWFAADAAVRKGGIEGHIFHDTASAHAAPVEREADSGQTLGVLGDILGWPEGEGDPSRKLDDAKQRWGVEDLAPALVMGSTPHLYMAFECNQGTDAATDLLQEIDAFTNTVTRLDPGVRKNLERELTDRAIGIREKNLSDRAAGVLVTRSTAVPWNSHTWWIGRVGLRVRLAQALVDLYRSHGRSMEEARQYVAELCLPGVRYHLLKAGALALNMEQASAARALLHLRSVVFLLQEQFTLSPDLECLAQIEEEWSFLSQLNTTPRPGADDAIVRMLEQCWLQVFAAQTLYATHQRAVPRISAIVDEVQARLWRCIDEPFSTGSADATVHVMEFGMSAFMTLLAISPEPIAKVLLDRRLEGSWQALPLRFQQRLREQLPQLPMAHLSRCVRGVSSPETLMEAIRPLRAHPGLLIGALGVLASRALFRQATQPEVSRSAILQPVAQSLLALRDAAGPRAAPPSRLPDLHLDIRGPSLRALEDSAAALLSNPGMVGELSAFLEASVDVRYNPDAPVIDGVALGVHGNVGRAEKRLRELYLSS